MLCKKKMKVLFIINTSNFVLGAIRSLGYVLRNTSMDYDIICSSFFRMKHSEEEIRRFCGYKCGKIFYCILPLEAKVIFPVEEPTTFVKKVSYKIRVIIQNILAQIYKLRIFMIIKKGNYDVVHLNAISIYPLITNKYCCVMHAREIFSGFDAQSFYSKLSKLSGIIYIDKTVQESIALDSVKSVVLNNPFDMTCINDIDAEQIRAQYNISEGIVVFSILGSLKEGKGVDFVISAFKRLPQHRIILLIVGRLDNREYVKKCVGMAQNDHRIMFLGEIVDVEKIYAISDYVIRGDHVFCIGRTVYEALYAGCGVLIPGNKNDLSEMPQYNLFKDRMFCYSPRNPESIITQIEELSQHKITNRVCYSNVDEYNKQFESFLDSVITSKREAKKC